MAKYKIETPNMSEWIQCPNCGTVMTIATSGYLCPMCGTVLPVKILHMTSGTSFKVDAVPVIRCRDCKHHQGYNCDRLYGFQDAFTFMDEDYCSKAERKEHETD